MTTDHGPWDDWREVLASTPAQQLGAALDTDQKNPALTHLTAACEAAGIPVGKEDLRILAWLSAWEVPSVVVIADLITRAYESGRQPEPGTSTRWAISTIHPMAPSVPRWVQPYPSEEDARDAVRDVAELAPDKDPRLVSRQVGPWKEAPGGTD